MIRSQEIYEALTDDEAFALLPGRLAREFGARSAIFGWHFNGTDPAFLAHNYFSHEAVDAYLRDFALSDPWVLAHIRHPNPNRAVDLALLAGLGAWEKSRVYNDWVRPLGDDTVHCAGLYVANFSGRGSLVVHRGKTQKPFDQGELDQVTAQGTHIRRLLSIKARLAAADRKGSLLQGFAEAAGPTILTNTDGIVLSSNRAGELLLADGRWLNARRGQLVSAVPAFPSLDDAIRKACSPIEPSAELVLLRRPGRKPVTVTVIPVSRPGPPVAMIVVDLLDDVTRGEDILAQRFKLSGAEVDVAMRIASGQVIKQIAEERNASPQTVKVQIKSIMAKLDCSRQIQIAALVEAALRMGSRLTQINGAIADPLRTRENS